MLFSSHFVTKLVQVRLTVGNLLPPKRCLIIETQRANMSISKSFFIRCIVVLLGVPLSAQTISSRLVDAKTQKGIPYATVQYGEQLGVITNEEGRFSFVLEEATLDSIYITSMGYGKKGFTLEQLQDTLLQLDPKAIELSGVYVFDKELEVEDIIEKMIENIPNNVNKTPVKQRFFLPTWRKSILGLKNHP